MNRYYRIEIDRRPVGSAVELREPKLRGEIITKVTDTRTRGFKIVVLDASDEEDQRNLVLPGVEALTPEDAGQLAAEFQPAVTRQRRDPRTRRVKKIEAPAADLQKILDKRAARGKKPGA